MVRLGAPEYGVTECAYTYNRVKITATLTKYIEVDVDDDIEAAVDEAIDSIDLSDFDYEYDIVGEDTELVYVKEA